MDIQGSTGVVSGVLAMGIITVLLVEIDSKQIIGTYELPESRGMNESCCLSAKIKLSVDSITFFLQ